MPVLLVEKQQPSSKNRHRPPFSAVRRSNPLLFWRTMAARESSWFWTVIRLLARRRRWHPTPVLLPGKSHERRSLVGCRPWGREESDPTEWLHFHFSLPCIGEGNGNPLQCFCLENPRDGGAWWAAVYGAAQSRTRLKWLSSLAACITYFLLIFIILLTLKIHIFTWKISIEWLQSTSHIVGLYKENTKNGLPRWC